ncbi:hypothetical protein BDQ17DRAFT_1335705 [Cyathus striatus]|nr:hypothetical protein BDQ17DRAFT_1335705 [Cyathus striatus]
MTKELPSPTSKDCPKWNGDGEKVKDWLRSLEIMYNHFEATDGEKRVKHALGCIAKADIGDEVEMFAEAKGADWTKFKQRLLQEYDPEEGECNGSVRKLEKIIEKYRPISIRDYSDWKIFKRKFQEEVSRCEKSEGGSLISNLSQVMLLSKVFSNAFREAIDHRLSVMIAVKTADVTKRSREDPYKLSDVIEAADQVMNATPIGGISLLADENKKSDTGNSRGIVKKEIIDSSLVEEAKIVAAQTSKELETFKAEMKGWMQQMQSTVTMAINRPAPPPVNQYRGPNNGFSNNTTYQYRSSNNLNTEYTGFRRPDCFYCGSCTDRVANCKVKAEDLRNGIIRDTPHGLVMAASGIKIPRVEGRMIKQEIDRILQMKEPEIRAMEAGNGRATMTQSTAPINEPPEHMKAMLLQYRHWIDSNAASTSQYIQTRTGYETNPKTDF